MAGTQESSSYIYGFAAATITRSPCLLCVLAFYSDLV